VGLITLFIGARRLALTTRFESEHNALDFQSMSCVRKPSSPHICNIVAFSTSTFAIHAPQTFFFGVVDSAPHQLPTEPVTLEPRAYQDREFGSLFVEFILQAYQPEQLACVFVEPVEMAELFYLLGAQLGNVRKKLESSALTDADDP
jgi:hypothetical protein